MRRFAIAAALAVLCTSGAAAQNIPLTFTLPEAGYVTLVVEDAAGNRVRNLVQEQYFPAGPNTVLWDGLDDGVPANRGRRNGYYDIDARLVDPGTYRVRALVHDGIDLVYEMSVQSPGQTPWADGTGAGGWMADHSAAYDVVFLPDGYFTRVPGPSMLFVSKVSEAGDGIVLVAPDGRKRWGRTNLQAGFRAGHQAARDVGPNRYTNAAAYVATVDKAAQLRLYRLSKAGNVNRDPFIYPLQSGADDELGGLAVYDQHAVVALPKENRLLFVDEQGKRLTGTADLPSPTGVFLTEAQQLYVLTGGRLERYDADVRTGTLSGRTVLVDGDLQDPRAVTVRDGRVYVADWGTRHHVRVYDLAGRLVDTIGTPGGPQLGRYDETRMAYPGGLTVDDEGQLWVAERHEAPKRVSRWDAATGAFSRAWYGPPKYGGGGMIDPQDRTRFYYAQQGVFGQMRAYEFELDWNAGTSRVSRVLVDEEHFPSPSGMPERAPEYARYVGGRQYMVNNNQYWGAGTEVVGLWMFEDDRLVPVGAAGNVGKWASVEALGEWAAYGRDARRVFFVWSDRDRDGRVEAGEVQYREQDRVYGTIYVEKDLSITSVWGYKVAAPTIGADGVPVYDLDTWTTIASGETGDPLGSFHLSDGSTFISFLGPFTFYEDGEPVATYHSQWPNRNPDGLDVPTEQYSGQLLNTSRPLGDILTPAAGEAGAVWGVNGEYGQAYLLTADGYFLTKLLDDYRTAPLWRFGEGEIQRGDVIENVSTNWETFWNTLNQTADGSIYYVTGKSFTSILRVDGLETVRRYDFGAVEVTADMLDDDPNLPPTVQVTAPADGAVLPAGEAVGVDAAAADADGTVARVQFFADGALIGEDAAAPFAASWTPTGAGPVTLTAVAVDDLGAQTTSAPVRVTVEANQAPEIRWLAPADGVVVDEGGDLVLQVDATDADGAVVSVRYFAGDVLLADTSATTYTWPTPTPGTYALTAVAVDDEGATALTAVRTAVVNARPTAALTSPENGAAFAYGASVAVAAAADDADGAVSRVRFYADGDLLADDAEAPFGLTWRDAAPGTHVLTAVAVDDRGAERTTAPVTITVEDNTPPSISLESPFDGQPFDEGDRIPLQAQAADPEGDVREVTFYADGEAVATVAEAPYAAMWDGAAVGTHTLTATVVDGAGSTAASAPVTITVNARPRVAVVSPTEDDRIAPGSEVTIVVDADDPDGRIVRVELLVGGRKLAEKTAAPFAFGPKRVKGGTFIVTARATDDRGAQTTSPAVAVVVGDQQRIALRPGWNLVSSYVAPAPEAPPTLKRGERPVRLRAEGADGGAAAAEATTLRETLDGWQPGRAYRVFAERPDTLVLSGAVLDTALALQAGRNVVPFLRAEAMRPADAFAGLGSALLWAKDAYGRLWAPALGVQTLTALEPGQGYVVQVADAAVLAYPSDAPAADAAPPARPGTGTDAVLVLDAPAAMEGLQAVVSTADGAEVGRGVVTDGRAVLVLPADLAATPDATEGARAGDALRLVLRRDDGTEHPYALGAVQTLGGPAHDALPPYETDAVWSVTVDEVPAAFALEGNYPNPFNPTTTIRYSLPEAAPVRLEVFDALGRRVAVLHDGPRAAGRHEAVWDATRAASGVYLYRLHAGAYHASGTMTLVK